MADQTQSPNNQHFINQPPPMYNQASQNAPGSYSPTPQPFVAPSESFGSFGPLPDDPAGIFPNQPSWAAPSFAPVNTLPSSPHNAYAPVYPTQGNPYAPGMPGVLPYAPYGMYAPFSTPVKTKKPLLFPVTRRAPALLQSFGMLLYSLVMALALMGCILILLKIALANVSLYVNADSSTNGLSIIITVVLALLLVPAISIFSGAFFGSWRGLIVSVLSLTGGLLLAHLSDSHFGNLRAAQITWPLLLALPMTALVVGFVYERRKYAAWWKSMLTMFLGTAVLLIWFLAFIFVIDVQTNTSTTQVNYAASLAISFGILALIGIPVLGLLFAGIEGIIHAILAGIRQRG